MTDYLRPYEIAKIKKVSYQTVYRWIREGIIPKNKVKKIKVERICIDNSVIENELFKYGK